MFPRIEKSIRERIQTRRYVMTLHAEEEMDEDELDVHDVERAILTGRIVERQEDRQWGEWKYRVRGESLDGRAVEVIVKLSPSGKLVVITLYVIWTKGTTSDEL